MKTIIPLAGAILGQRCMGRGGLFLGAVLGWGLATLLSRASPPPGRRQERQRQEHDRRYPEEAVIDALAHGGDEPARAGEELEDVLYRLSGRQGPP